MPKKLNTEQWKLNPYENEVDILRRIIIKISLKYLMLDKIQTGIILHYN